MARCLYEPRTAATGHEGALWVPMGSSPLGAAARSAWGAPMSSLASRLGLDALRARLAGGREADALPIRDAVQLTPATVRCL